MMTIDWDELERRPLDTWTVVENTNDPSVRPPEGFWKERPCFEAVRDAAHHVQRAPLAVLHVVLARLAASAPQRLMLPGIVGVPVGLSYMTALLGPSGTGKGTAAGAAERFVPFTDSVVDCPVGTGEGIVEALFSAEDPDGKSRKKVQTRFNCFVYVDEGQVISELGNRKGSTLLPTLRTIFTGGVVGTQTADATRRRILHRGRYVYGVVAGFQPAKAGDLLADADAGTPQRFTYVDTTDPEVPETLQPWPTYTWQQLDPGEYAHLETYGPDQWLLIPVAESVAKEVRAADLAKVRGEVIPQILDTHSNLIRLKIAALLGVLERRVGITEDDWAHAGLLLGLSDLTRDLLAEHLAEQAKQKEQAASERLANRQVHAVEKTEAWHVVQTAKRLCRIVDDADGQRVEGRALLRRRLSKPQRDYFEDALDHALGAVWLTEQTEPSHTGDPKHTYTQGPKFRDGLS